jgi:hypothetical protein
MSEATEQAKVILWANQNRARLPDLRWLFHTPNGGMRDKRVAGQMVALGVKRGVPDLLMPVARDAYVGLAAEMKTDEGRLTKDQVEWLDHFERQGWLTAVWRSADQAIADLEEYLG